MKNNVAMGRRTGEAMSEDIPVLIFSSGLSLRQDDSVPGPRIAICAIGALVRHQLHLSQRLTGLSPDAHLKRATRR